MVSDPFQDVEGRSFVQAIYGSKMDRAIRRSAIIEGDEMLISIQTDKARYQDNEARLLEDPDQKAAVDLMLEAFQNSKIKD